MKNSILDCIETEPMTKEQKINMLKYKFNLNQSVNKNSKSKKKRRKKK